VALIAFYLGWTWMALLATISLVIFTGFFRDPERRSPQGEGVVVSPADGKVVAIKQFGRSNTEKAGTQVSIFLSPLDVHINRAPIAGKVEQQLYRPGKFHAAYRDKASQDNEQNALTIVGARGERLRVVQIAGVLARRIVCHVKEGDALDMGQRFGLIMFGSRVDLFLPLDAQIAVSEGQWVRAGETIMARLA
jgi:phosphatidylserine decarboxylase